MLCTNDDFQQKLIFVVTYTVSLRIWEHFKVKKNAPLPFNDWSYYFISKSDVSILLCSHKYFD